MIEEFKKSYKNGFEVMLSPEERDILVKYIKELEHANNIINELEKWLDKEINQLKFEDDYESADTLKIVQETLKELKGSDKE